MKRTVEYELGKDELRELDQYLWKKSKYKVHAYRVMNRGTIDDGSSVEFEKCS